MFKKYYNGKRVLITGHTGFKGSWLTCWLLELGAEIIGVSKDIPTNPSMFEALKLEKKINHNIFDINDSAKLHEIIEQSKPDYIFHLAAQAIVSRSYTNPLETITTNVMGTANILDTLRRLNYDCCVVIITSDKCYENVEWCWGYKETDHLGGKDIYSGSKGAAEIIFHSYFKSFFSRVESKVKVASARAGNVIGGGDWAEDRIVADSIRSWSKGEKVLIRSPNATRPWQHVLEPLSGYLVLGVALANNAKVNGESFNFGPRSEQNHTVENLIQNMSKHWKFNDCKDSYEKISNNEFNEAGLLKLNCDKALFLLNWRAALSYSETVKFVSEWYFNFYNSKNQNMLDFTMEQIKDYNNFANRNEISWAI